MKYNRGIFVKFQKWRRIWPRLIAVLEAWNGSYPEEKMNPNGFLNAAIDGYIRKFERKLGIKGKRLDR